jgi:hypothetical protein
VPLSAAEADAVFAAAVLLPDAGLPLSLPPQPVNSAAVRTAVSANALYFINRSSVRF